MGLGQRPVGHLGRDLPRHRVPGRPRAVVRVGDVAELRIGHLTRYGMVTKDGTEEAVEGLVHRVHDAGLGGHARDVLAFLGCCVGRTCCPPGLSVFV